MGLIVRFGDPENPIYEFRKNEIVSVAGNKNVNLIGEELSIDTLTPVVRFTVIHPDPLIDSEGVPLVDANGEPLIGYGTGDIRIMPHGTKATLYEVYGDEENLKAVYYVDDVERIAKDQYQINCMSIIGRLEEQHWVGRIYYNNKRIYEVLEEIFGDSIDYQMSVFIQNRVIYGYIPNGTKREALYHLMLSYGIGIKPYAGTLWLGPVGVGNSGIIPDDRIYIGGKVTYPKPPSSLQVTAHYWDILNPTAEWESRVVFDNTQTLEPANNEVIDVDFVYGGFEVEFVEGEDHLSFELQGHPELVTGSTGRFTVFSGVGKLTLKCPPRIDTIIEVTNPDADVNRVVSVSDELMISPYNAQAVAKRLMSYYTNGKIIETSIVLGEETCGNVYDFNNAFGEAETAAMTSMQTVYSGVTKANCRFVSGYDAAYDFPYSDYIKYDHSQTIDLTALKQQGTTKIGILLVGGGQAGFDGEDGEDGENTEPPFHGDYIKRGGKGGKGGQAGNGGNTNFAVIDITDVDELVLTVGEGGAENGEEGGITSISYMSGGLMITIDTDGTETFSTGTLNPLSGEVYGERGRTGVSGGDGGNSGRIWACQIINGDNFQWDDGQVDEFGLPLDVTATVEAQDGQRCKAGGASLNDSYPPGGKASDGNYGTNLLMFLGYTDSEYGGKKYFYYSYGGAGGGGASYLGAGENAEAVYVKRENR